MSSFNFMKTFVQILGNDNCFEHKKHHHWHQHHNNMGNRATGKYKIGPGGIDCPCCTKLPPTELKKAMSRYKRRKDKQFLNTTASDQDHDYKTKFKAHHCDIW